MLWSIVHRGHFESSLMVPIPELIWITVGNCRWDVSLTQMRQVQFIDRDSWFLPWPAWSNSWMICLSKEHTGIHNHLEGPTSQLFLDGNGRLHCFVIHAIGNIQHTTTDETLTLCNQLLDVFLQGHHSRDCILLSKCNMQFVWLVIIAVGEVDSLLTIMCTCRERILGLISRWLQWIQHSAELTPCIDLSPPATSWFSSQLHCGDQRLSRWLSNESKFFGKKSYRMYRKTGARTKTFTSSTW